MTDTPTRPPPRARAVSPSATPLRSSPSRTSRARARLDFALQYPRGWWRLALHSRFAGWIPVIVTGFGYAYAAAPDFGVAVLRGPVGLAALLALWLLSSWATQFAVGAELRAHHRAFETVGDVISVLAGNGAAASPARGAQDPGEAIVLLLRRAQEVASASLRPPPGCELSAHLLLPEVERRRGGALRVAGLWAAYHDDHRPGRHPALVLLDGSAAGRAFSTGTAAVVADAAGSLNPGSPGDPYRSIAAFPVTLGSGRSRRVIGVLTLEASTPYVFTPKRMPIVAPFLHPIAQLIGLVMTTHGLEKRP